MVGLLVVMGVNGCGGGHGSKSAQHISWQTVVLGAYAHRNRPPAPRCRGQRSKKTYVLRKNDRF